MTSGEKSEEQPHPRYDGAVFRVTHPDYRDLARTVEVSRKFPARFNPAGIGALYVALSREVALEELKRRATKVGRSVASFAPRSLFVLDACLENVLDLTHARVRVDWDITLEDLRTDDVYDRCQNVALVARHEGYEAVRFPSATGRGENLAIFYDRMSGASYVSLVSEEAVDLARI